MCIVRVSPGRGDSYKDRRVPWARSATHDLSLTRLVGGRSRRSPIGTLPASSNGSRPTWKRRSTGAVPGEPLPPTARRIPPSAAPVRGGRWENSPTPDPRPSRWRRSRQRRPSLPPASCSSPVLPEPPGPPVPPRAALFFSPRVISSPGRTCYRASPPAIITARATDEPTEPGTDCHRDAPATKQGD